MIVSIAQGELQAALAVVSNIALANKEASSSCIHLATNNGKLVLSATNPQESARCRASALVEEDGELVVPARKFCDIVKTLPAAMVTIEAVNDEFAKISCGKIEFNIQVLDVYNFPGFREFGVADQSNTISIDIQVFADMLSRCALSAARGDTKGRPIFAGVHIKAEDEMVYVTATDSYVATQAKFGISGQQVSFSGVVPLSFALRIGAIKEHGGAKVSIALNKCRVVLHGGTEFVTGLLEGNYPDVDRLFPEVINCEARFKASALKASINRARALGNKDYSPVTISLENDTAQVSSKVQSGEALVEDIECKTSGSGFFNVNANMLANAVTSIGIEDIDVCVVDPLKPITIKGIHTRALVMPVRP